MEKVLIVDDNPKNIQLLANILDEQGYEVDYAQDGSEALQLIDKGNYGLVLMDVIMPVIGGYEACSKIKANEDHKDIPVIFITAKTDAESISNGFGVGGVDYIVKPFNASELLARVRTHLDMSNYKRRLKEMNVSLEQKVKERTIDLKKSNDELKLAKLELEELDQAKSNFLTLISHEIRTPLNGILGFSSLISDMVENQELDDLVNMLKVSCKRLNDFSTNALTVSILNLKGKSGLNIEQFNINNCIDEIINDKKGDFAQRAVHLETTNPEVSIYGDKELLNRAIDIILSNAYLHAPNESKIEMVGEIRNGFYLLTVKDQGKGFPDKMVKLGIKNLFTNEHINNNNGIDLYMCKIISMAHGGDLLISNNKGAIVKMHIPLGVK